MPKIAIFYFSGSGNTEIVANLFKSSFEARDCEVCFHRIDDIIRGKDYYKIDDCSLVGIIYPVHAFNAPRIVFEFIKNNLPKTVSQKAFIIKSPGDPLFKGGSTIFVRSKLKKKGYNVIYEDFIVMAANVFIRYKDNLVKQLYEIAKIRVEKIVNSIFLGKIKIEKSNIFLAALTLFFSAGESFGTKYFGKNILKVNKLCILCEKCIKDCPTENISIKNHEICFGKNCLFCLRCVYGCPKKAIEAKMLFSLVPRDLSVKSIIANENVSGDYLNSKTKGWHKKYYDYMMETESEK